MMPATVPACLKHFAKGGMDALVRRDRITQSVAEEVAQMRKDFSRQAPDAPAA